MSPKFFSAWQTHVQTHANIMVWGEEVGFSSSQGPCSTAKRKSCVSYLEETLGLLVTKRQMSILRV